MVCLTALLIFSNVFLNNSPNAVTYFFWEPQQTPYTKWLTLIVLSMMAVMFLPRQFHIMVTENTDEQHIKSAMWKFPAYLFLINLFVLPIALGGLIINGGDTTQADYFVLTLPPGVGAPMVGTSGLYWGLVCICRDGHGVFSNDIHDGSEPPDYACYPENEYSQPEPFQVADKH